jgi:hypothetical protein
MRWNTLFILHQPDAHHLIPGYNTYRIAVNLAGDLIFVAGPFVPEGNFWNKLRALFIQRAKAHFPTAT